MLGGCINQVCVGTFLNLILSIKRKKTNASGQKFPEGKLICLVLRNISFTTRSPIYQRFIAKMEADEAQLLVTKAMQDGEDSSDDEDGSGGSRSGVQLDGIRHLSVMMPTPLDEAGVMAQGKLEFERYIHRAATEVGHA